jgi:5-methylcytosine-specific restriction endonuclease McrA
MERRRLSDEERRSVYDSTDGNCHICRKKLSWVNYDRPGRRGAWHVDHSNPVAKGGTSYLRNLKPACIDCNRDKSAMTTRTARGWNGHKAAPLPKAKKDDIKGRNTAIGIGAGAAAGGAVFGPVGAIVGAIVGGIAGNSVDPNPD